MTRVLLFGTFDPLHDGHRALFHQAAVLGDTVVVVAARDSYIREVKKREPRRSAEERYQALVNEPVVSEVMWGDEWPNTDPYRLLRDLNFDVLALGHDQTPTDEEAQAQLKQLGKGNIPIIRLKEALLG